MNNTKRVVVLLLWIIKISSVETERERQEVWKLGRQILCLDDTGFDSV